MRLWGSLLVTVAAAYTRYDGPVPPTARDTPENDALIRRFVTENPNVPSRARDGDPWGDGGPACDLPVYSLENWMAAHGRRFPDHPCLFAAGPTTWSAGFRDVPDMRAFLAAFGNETVDAKPGYAQAGGQYCAAGVPVHVAVTLRLGDLAREWDAAMRGFYVSQFGCGPLCERTVASFGVRPSASADGIDGRRERVKKKRRDHT